MFKTLFAWTLFSIIASIVITAALYFRAGHLRAFFVTDKTIARDDILNTPWARRLNGVSSALMLSSVASILAMGVLALSS